MDSYPLTCDLLTRPPGFRAELLPRSLDRCLLRDRRRLNKSCVMVASDRARMSPRLTPSKKHVMPVRRQRPIIGMRCSDRQVSSLRCLSQDASCATRFSAAAASLRHGPGRRQPFARKWAILRRHANLINRGLSRTTCCGTDSVQPPPNVTAEVREDDTSLLRKTDRGILSTLEGYASVECNRPTDEWKCAWQNAISVRASGTSRR